MNFNTWKGFIALWRIHFLKASVILSRVERVIEVFQFPSHNCPGLCSQLPPKWFMDAYAAHLRERSVHRSLQGTKLEVVKEVPRGGERGFHLLFGCDVVLSQEVGSPWGSLPPDSVPTKSQHFCSSFEFIWPPKTRKMWQQKYIGHLWYRRHGTGSHKWRHLTNATIQFENKTTSFLLRIFCRVIPKISASSPPKSFIHSFFFYSTNIVESLLSARLWARCSRFHDN